VTVEARGEETPSESESSGNGREEEDEDGEGEIISPPQSPLPKRLLSLGDLFGWRMGIPARVRQAKCPGQIPTGRVAYHHSPTLHYYVLFGR
jgi:hypothetical protein